MTTEDQPVLAGRVVGSRPLKSRFPARIISSNSVSPRLSAAAFSARRSASAGQMKCGILTGFFVIVWSIMSQPLDLNKLAQQIKQWGTELGFQQVGITDTDLSASEPKLQAWLDKQYHGEMEWMARHGMMRARPHELQPGTLRVISVRMNYLPANAAFARTLKDPSLGYVSRYALGRDYHKLLRNRLKKLGEMIQEQCASLNFRPFVDSAPILERPLAEKAGLGWTGKHSLILNRDAGSFFFSANCSLIFRSHRQPGDGRVRPLRGLHDYLPHRRDRRTLYRGCPSLYLLSDH
jgi:epoxyqueuosine reductase